MIPNLTSQDWMTILHAMNTCGCPRFVDQCGEDGCEECWIGAAADPFGDETNAKLLMANIRKAEARLKEKAE